ncbi:MAG: nuclear transport factor 2 family protein [Pseudomonadota bacterium]
MRRLLVLPLLFALTAQAMPSQPMPKGTGLPPPTVDEAAVLAPINRLFDAMARRDAAALMAELRPEGGATVAIEAPEGRAIGHKSWAEFAKTLGPGTQKFEERLIDPMVDIDGDIAMVWSRYVFLIDGKLSHCGMDHFDLVRENGSWKILNLTWSKRTTGCTTE